MKVAIGFDTSCYTTSVAAVDCNGNVIASRRMLLPVKSGQRGLRQSEAVFAHVKQIPPLAEQLQDELQNAEITAVAASSAPRSQEDSYMPVFTVGTGHARTLAAMLNVPGYLFSHQQGHIAAGQIDGNAMPERFLALHLSGGTTELLLSQKDELTLLGGTLDLHAGQLIDRIGVKMGLPFPAGPSLESLALRNTEPVQALLPVSMEQGDLYCHFSGAETQCMRWLEKGTYTKERIAAEVFDVLARTVARLLKAASFQTGGLQALIVGGVASSTLLRELVAIRLGRICGMTLHFGKPEYSGDNAAGIAWLGMRKVMASRSDPLNAAK